MLLTLLQLTSESALYPISTFPPSPVLTILGVLCYGLITPLAEELLFRGILLQKLRLVTTQNRAILISAFLFGFYHLNVTQAIYGFVIGMIMAYAYLNFGKFWIPLAIHMLSNLLAFFFNFFGLSGTILLNWPLCVGFLCILIGTAFLLIKAQSAQPMGYKRLS
ncbi:MAG: CPBP family intramembrane metalloprotease [Lachnospiraceae bacterium]|nr:CPBP family intramembrane metalloprotease [Lachnospiraceae bacterium]